MHKQLVAADMLQMPCSACCRHSIPACRLPVISPASCRARQPVQSHRQRRRHGLVNLRYGPACCMLPRRMYLASNAHDAMMVIMLRLRAGSTRCAWRGAAAQPQQPMGWTPGSLEAAGAAVTAAATTSRQHRRHHPQPAQQRELSAAACQAGIMWPWAPVRQAR
jgi:hypothetical protein